MTNREVPVQIEQARKVLGYRSHPMRESAFGRDVKYSGQPWAGSYVHEVLREVGLLETSMISTSAALGWFAKNNRLFTSGPKPGDIVFFAFPSTGLFGQPHVGLVTETDRFKSESTFRTIEGETASGLSRGNQDPDGVFERTRYETDVLAFVRPEEPRPEVLQGLDPEVLTVRPSNFAHRSAARAAATEAVQNAIFHVLGTGNFNRGVWDAHTRAAFEAFLRYVGVYETVGDVPTDAQLQILGDTTFNRFFQTPELT